MRCKYECGGDESSGARGVKRGTGSLCIAATAPLSETAMERLTLDTPVPEALRGAILALGNFDGKKK